MTPLNVLTKQFMRLSVEMEPCDNPSEYYKLFLKKFLTIYENIFPRKKIKLKVKDIQSPWITNEIKKSSKRKQRLYEKFLKTRSHKSELEYKTIKIDLRQ